MILVSASDKGELVCKSEINSGAHHLSSSEYLLVWTEIFNAAATNEHGCLRKTKGTGSEGIPSILFNPGRAAEGSNFWKSTPSWLKSCISCFIRLSMFSCVASGRTG